MFTLENHIKGNYVLSFTPEDDGEYALYAWYQHPSGNQKYGNNQIDHYSIYGTQMIIDYWENELIPYYGDAFENCRSLFIDSLEFETHLDWTYDLDEVFEETYDYDIVTYLAAVYDSSDDVTAIGNYMGDAVSTFTYDKNTDEIQNDYKETLTNLYIENHIKPLQEFCEKYNVTLRYQTSYGKNLEVSNTALYPDIPETETLYGNDYTDFYRLQSGAVHTSDKTIYSIESAAEWTETWNEKNDDGEYGTRGNGNSNSGNYEQTFLDHIWHDQRAFASGVNQIVFHGYAYSGVYQDEALDDVSWPGFTGFESYKWSNSWGERQPNWDYASTYTNYLSRIQYTLRQGTANIDLAIYHHSYYETIDFYNPDTIFDTDVLEQNGYSYDFISPSTMELDNMKVKDGILDSDGTQYKALIFNDETDLPEETIEKIVEYAENGLVIIFIGSVPNSEKIKSLLELENVLQINGIDEIANTLKSNNIIADASYDNQTLLTTHRSDNNTEYYYLYNYGGVDSYSEMSDVDNVVTSVTLQGEGDPYLADAWTGEIVKITDYTENNGSVTVEVDIAANDSNIIILSEEDISNASENTSSIDYEITLDNWTLTVESWTKGDTVLDTDKTEINIGELEELTTWDNIEGLENVSGIGTYTTSFNIEDYNESESIYIHLGKINDAYGVTINGTEVIVDQASGDCEISKYLNQGNNIIEITIATSLLNAILYENRNVLNDDGRILDDRNTSSYGLTTDVIINGTK
ncbi:MAG: hypothetical protein LUG12_07300 [Erysipelotrichaceae bacterium]|nr:hypothetical protein [Erysipelotrichaceae bacterium]